jgi:pSer/pThr/pTyr-binding forkhead associated (FHA) protein
MIKLQLKFKATILKELVTDKTEIAIGRDTASDLCIDNLAASSCHARLFKGPDDKYAVEDMNSTNGTFVNGKQVMTKVLDDNDLITIGKHTIHVAYQDGDAFKKQKSSGVGESTYILDKKDLEKITR